MAIQYEGDLARLIGTCDVAEALDFSEWLGAPDVARMVDLSEAEHLHLAVFQCLQYFRPETKGRPKDEFLAYLLDAAASEQHTALMRR